VDLDLARVRAFVAVADEGHFGHAAVRLSVTQQGLSKRVARLEAELGVRLLTRNATGVSLTEAGRQFHGPARRLEDFLERVRTSPGAFSLLPADLPLPPGTGGAVVIETVPIVDPTPLYAWSLIWRRDDHHPRLAELLEAFGAAGRVSRWLEFRADTDWLPDPDRAEALRVHL
jgi:DNA-binding transcriptional LysR family regulator